MTTPSPLTATSVAVAARYAESWLELRARTLRVPGVQAAIWFGDELVHSSAHGVADLQTGERLTAQHLFRIASHSKTFTATAVLQLVEAGTVRLDDRADTWLPFLDGSPLAAVTLREMLGHTSGAIRDGKDSDFWQLARAFPDEAELRRIALDDAAVLAPNERFKYSNITYSLLGMVVSAASGVPYNAYVSERIVDRLGLTRTGPELDPSRAGEYAAGHTSLTYADHRIRIEHVDTAAMSAATGFYGTADEIVRYAAAHFPGDDRLLGAGAKRLMQRVESEVGGDEGHYGLGFDVAEVAGRRLFGHGGGYPGHITRTVFDPEQRLAVSVFTNAIDGPAQELAHGVVHIIDLAAGQEAQARAALPGADVRAVDLERFTGRFASLWGVVDIVCFGGRLLALNPAAPNPTENPTELSVEDASTLRITKTSGYGAPGEALGYRFAADGSVRSVHGGGGMTSYPVEAFSAAMAARSVIDVAGGGALLPDAG